MYNTTDSKQRTLRAKINKPSLNVTMTIEKDVSTGDRYVTVVWTKQVRTWACDQEVVGSNPGA